MFAGRCYDDRHVTWLRQAEAFLCFQRRLPSDFAAGRKHRAGVRH
jgi:hypothetical protein